LAPYSQFRKYVDFDKWDERKSLNIGLIGHGAIPGTKNMPELDMSSPVPSNDRSKPIVNQLNKGVATTLGKQDEQ
jgi:hypothetical protein